MSTFHFKHFDVRNDLSTMKVNTDGVLLGAAVPLSGDETRILDVGTGTGTIALMLAQRLLGVERTLPVSSKIQILGIDIDAPSVEEAAANFAASPWAECLRPELVPLQELDRAPRWDLIVSNPPYYDNSLQAPDPRRNAARHTEVGQSLSYRDLVSFAAASLSAGGRLALILPSVEEMPLLRYAASFSLFPKRITSVRTTPSKAPSRMIMVLAGGGGKRRRETR